MAQSVLDCNAGALGKADDKELLRSQAAAFTGIFYQPMAPLDGTRQNGSFDSRGSMNRPGYHRP